MKKRIISILTAVIMMILTVAPAFAAEGRQRTIKPVWMESRIVLSGFVERKTETLSFKGGNLTSTDKTTVYYVTEGSSVSFVANNSSDEHNLWGWRKRGEHYEMVLRANREGTGNKSYKLSNASYLYAASGTDGESVSFIYIKVIPNDDKKDDKPAPAESKTNDTASDADEKKFSLSTLERQVEAFRNELAKLNLYDSRLISINNQLVRLSKELADGKKLSSSDKLGIHTQLTVIDVWIVVLDVNKMNVYEKAGAPRKTDKAGLDATQKRIDTLRRNSERINAVLYK